MFLIAGNMWAQDWGNIYDILAPYPNVSQTNLTQAMLAQVITRVRTARLVVGVNVCNHIITLL